MCWNAVSFPISFVTDLTEFENRLAYSELYITIGTLLRRYPNLKTEKLEGRSLEYEDYFAPYRPKDAKLFSVWSESGDL